MTTVYDRDAFERAHGRLRRAPEELTSLDVEQLTAFSPDLGREALAARGAALFPAPALPTPAAAPRPGATKGGLSAASIDAIAEGVVVHVQEQLGPVLARLNALERQPPSPHYEGVFQDGKSYARGSLTTKSGGLWLATVEGTTEVPGRSDEWKLVVKSGEAPR